MRATFPHTVYKVKKLYQMDKIKRPRINLEPCAQCKDSSPYHLNDVGHARASQARLLTPISSIFAHPCPISNFSMEFSL